MGAQPPPRPPHLLGIGRAHGALLQGAKKPAALSGGRLARRPIRSGLGAAAAGEEGGGADAEQRQRGGFGEGRRIRGGEAYLVKP